MKKIATCLTVLVLLNTTACGYFLYPERVGQTEGKLDPTVVVLDAAGLLVGIIPGVVAFAVDVTTGAIYLPPGGKSSVEKHADRMTLSDDVELKPVNGNDVPIDTHVAAAQLSNLLGHEVSANDIVYYHTDTPVSDTQLKSLQ